MPVFSLAMKGLFRLRFGSPTGIGEDVDSDNSGDDSSCDSDVEEECVEVEKKLDKYVRRFEMIYPNSTIGDDQTCVLENRVNKQDTHISQLEKEKDAHISQLEKENLMLKEKLFLMERELRELRRRVKCLGTDGGLAPENVAEIINDVANH